MYFFCAIEHSYVDFKFHLKEEGIKISLHIWFISIYNSNLSLQAF